MKKNWLQICRLIPLCCQRLWLHSACPPGLETSCTSSCLFFILWSLSLDHKTHIVICVPILFFVLAGLKKEEKKRTFVVQEDVKNIIFIIILFKGQIGFFTFATLTIQLYENKTLQEPLYYKLLGGKVYNCDGAQSRFLILVDDDNDKK